MKTRLLLAAMLALPACAGVSTNTRLAPGVDLAQYRTFAFVPRTTEQPETLADQTIRSSIAQNLGQKGIVFATSSPPDFLVDYHAKTQQRVEMRQGYYGGLGWTYPDINSYTEGTLIVDFIDPATHQIFWRGTASAVVAHSDNPDPSRIDHAVAKLVRDYPSQVAAVRRPQM
jgi:hypothetical protein